MSDAPAPKFHMSLDEAAKLMRKENAEKRKQAAAEKAAANPKPAAAAAAPKAKKAKVAKAAKGNNNASAEAKKSSETAAKSVGIKKAKRAAELDKKRGLSDTAKPSKIQVKQSVAKALVKAAKKVAPKAAAAKAVAAATAKKEYQALTISFNANEVFKTTDKVVAAQIRAAYQKRSNVGQQQNINISAAIKKDKNNDRSVRVSNKK